MRTLQIKNELKVGDTIELSTENGTKVSVQIIGIFMSAGNAEKDQPSETTAVNRMKIKSLLTTVLIKNCSKKLNLKKSAFTQKDQKN